MSVNVTQPKPAAAPLTAPNPLFLRDEELSRGLDLLDLAYRALISESERRLASAQLGRHHQRLIHLIGREPGITMARLLDVVLLSKQSVSRLLQDLEARGLIVREADPRDRRQRRLMLSAEGRSLNEQLSARLHRRLAGAYRAAGAEAVAGYHKVLLGLVDDRARRRLQGGFA
jgi:DNA-binding MarR family transcriptional regulator